MSLALLAMLVLGPPQGTSSPVRTRDDDNGIVVSRVEVYNDASLNRRLRDLSGKLSALLGVPADAIRAGLFQSQAFDSSRTSSAVSLLTAPLPSVESVVSKTLESTGQTVKTTGESTSSGTTTTGATPGTTLTNGSKTGTETTDPTTKQTDKNETTTKSGGTSPTVPTAGGTSAFTLSGNVAQRAFDRLNEYASLYYDVTNLQTVLERATNQIVDLDRKGPRVPVVLGFPVSVVPTPSESGAVAEVVVNVDPLKSGGAGGDADAMVTSLLPKERTYNVAKVVSDQRSASLGAVFSVINLGVSTSSARDRMYFVQDYDTVALFSRDAEVMKGVVRFGWQFRPVFGEKTVHPGVRNLLVGLSLSNIAKDARHVLDVTVTTRWRRYDAKTRTAGDYIGKESTYSRQVTIEPKSLRPQINNIAYQALPDGSIAVDAHGTNLFDGDILVGNRVLPSGTFQNLASGNVRFPVTLSELVRNDLAYVSIFGNPDPLEQEITLDDTAKPDAAGARTKAAAKAFFQDSKAYASEIEPDVMKVTVAVPGDWRSTFALFRPMIATSVSAYGLDPSAIELGYDAGRGTLLSVRVPYSELARSPQLTLAVPFTQFSDGTSVRVSLPIEVSPGFDITSAKQTGTIKKGEATVGLIYTVIGRGLKDVQFFSPDNVSTVIQPNDVVSHEMTKFDSLNTVEASESVRLIYIKTNAPVPVKSIVGRKVVAAKMVNLDKVTLERVYTLNVPEEKKKVTVTAVETVTEGYEGAVYLYGDGLERVKLARWSKKELRFHGPQTISVNGKDQKVWFIEVPKEMTKLVGKRPFSLILDDDSEIVVRDFTILKAAASPTTP